MKKNLILSRIFTWCICIYLLPLRAFALTGNQIISSANEYVNFTWVCNSENARELNKDGIWSTSDPIYPFIAKGEPTGPDPDGGGPLAAPTSTGVSIGAPYGWGLGETVAVIGNGIQGNSKGGKLANIKTPFRAGLLDEDLRGKTQRPWGNYYTGIDCSGFVANCSGLPALRMHSKSEYWMWHPSSGHFKLDVFSEPVIFWKDVVPGDIFVKPGRHIALAVATPIESSSRVDFPVIESAVMWDGSYRSKVVSNTYYASIDIYGNLTTSIWRSHENSYGYEIRRLTPSYIKKAVFYKANIVDGKIDSYTKIYEKYWEEQITGERKLESFEPKLSGIAEAGIILVDLTFTKGMAVRTPFKPVLGGEYAHWQDKKILFGRSGTNQSEWKEMECISDSNVKAKMAMGEKGELFKGWHAAVDVDAVSDVDVAKVYTKWAGEITIDDIDNFGEFTLKVYAKSIMQDELDADPSTVTKRTPSGRWEGYTPDVDTNHIINIVPKGSVLYMSGQGSAPVGTATPYIYDKVIVKDYKQIPTEEPTYLPENMTPIPTPTNVVPDTDEVFIGDYIKGVLYGLVGEADFSDSKYENGFKALAVAAYTQLLREIEVNKEAGNSYDVMVNGYAGKQNYFITYKKLSGISGTKSLIDKVVDELVKPINIDGNCA